jgi:hypothetical protein
MKNKLYFLTKEGGFCQNIESIYDEMRIQKLNELQVYEAVRTYSNDLFYCKHFGEVGEKGLCGKQCPYYEPRNGKSGCCKHVGNMYKVGELVTIKLK